MTIRLNAGDETRIMADALDGVCLPLCDIKCGGMTGRTVAEGERIAADMVARYNAFATIPDPLAFVLAARVLHRALEGVIDATASYLPPDGISKDDCINRVLAASDNADVVHALRAFRAATGEA